MEEVIVVGNESCGIAETENTEKSRVMETAKMVDFIMCITEEEGDYTKLFLKGERTRGFTLARPCNTLSL